MLASVSWVGVMAQAGAAVGGEITPIQLRLGACSAKSSYPSPIKGEAKLASD